MWQCRPQLGRCGPPTTISPRPFIHRTTLIDNANWISSAAAPRLCTLPPPPVHPPAARRLCLARLPAPTRNHAVFCDIWSLCNVIVRVSSEQWAPRHIHTAHATALTEWRHTTGTDGVLFYDTIEPDPNHVVYDRRVEKQLDANLLGKYFDEIQIF